MGFHIQNYFELRPLVSISIPLPNTLHSRLHVQPEFHVRLIRNNPTSLIPQPCIDHELALEFDLQFSS
jgi:hypothetical protein